jgi:hypothetical protein
MIPVQPESKKIFIDGRAEIASLFYGDAITPGFSFQVIVRHVDKTQRCACWDYLKKEADRDCKNCSGSGWLVYDKVYRTVKRKYIGKEEADPAGLYEVDSTLFFFEHDVNLTEEDRIIEVVTDECGDVVSPVKYIKRHSIKDVEVLRGNNGRPEFIKIFASKAE